MPVERAPLVARLSLHPEVHDGLTLHAGSIDGRQVVAMVTGMGTTLATGAMGRLFAAVDVERVLVVGIAGGVENDTPIGTMVMPERVVNSHTGASFEPHAVWSAKAQPRGVMWTTDVLLSGADVLADLRAKGVVALDMETAAIAAACQEAGVPWSVYRAISDRPDDEVDEAVFQLSNQDGTPNPGNIIRYVLRHPGRVPRLARMGRNVRRATNAAADAAIAAVRSA